MTALTLSNLTKVYESGTVAISALDLDVESGELLVLLGPSGCGKTTTLRLIAGLLQPTAGDICFDGRSALQLPPEKRGAVMVFQENALFPFRSVRENVAFGLQVRKLDRNVIRRRVAEALAAVQMEGFEDYWPDQLSGGQKQRVALARALVVRPNLLLMDEPLSNLDRGLRERLRTMIRDLQQEARITTIFVTHDQAEAVAMADRIALIVNGRLRQVGTPRDFYERPADAQVAGFFGDTNILPGVKEGRMVHTQIGPVEVLPARIADGPVLLTIRPEAVEIGRNGHNSYSANVQSYQYRGLSARCRASINGWRLHVVTQPFHVYQEGEAILVHLPRERIHLLPAPEEGESA
jgi:ABC-type Fe3+/spermidine/putrescine transport system ATPase subunit